MLQTQICVRWLQDLDHLRHLTVAPWILWCSLRYIIIIFLNLSSKSNYVWMRCYMLMPALLPSMNQNVLHCAWHSASLLEYDVYCDARNPLSIPKLQICQNYLVRPVWRDAHYRDHGFILPSSINESFVLKPHACHLYTQLILPSFTFACKLRVWTRPRNEARNVQVINLMAEFRLNNALSEIRTIRPVRNKKRFFRTSTCILPISVLPCWKPDAAAFFRWNADLVRSARRPRATSTIAEVSARSAANVGHMAWSVHRPRAVC
jgi:hypothetical protein